MIKVYHNPRCSKSRQCLAFLEHHGQPYEIVKYLDDTPDCEELKDIIAKLDVSAIQIVRQQESIWIEKFKGKTLTDDEIISAMVAHPILIQRPIVIKENKAMIARDSDTLDSII